MRKFYFLLSILLLVFLFVSSAIPSSAYSGGLLNGKTINIGPDKNTSTTTTTKVTDVDLTTSEQIQPDGGTNAALWYEFPQEVTINGYQVSAGAGDLYYLGLYDSAGTNIQNIYPIDVSGTKVTFSEIPHVKKVALAWGSYGGTPGIVKEFDVFGTGLTVSPDAPIGLSATAGDTQIGLTWTTSTGATNYNIKRSTTAGGPYSTIASNIAGTSYNDTTVTNGTTYYYVVAAVNSGGESGNSNEASATPQAPEPSNRITLTITMTNGLEREYDLSMSEFNAFTTWYDTKAAGSGPARYTFVNPLAKGPYVSRNSSVIFDKILTFDYDEYVPNN
jgi:hypothetical protein